MRNPKTKTNRQTAGVLSSARSGARSLRRIAAIALAVMAMATPTIAADPNLAPTGTLRAAFLSNNPVHARTDPATGAITGPVVDLVAELARRLRVPYKMIPAANAAGVIADINNRTADIGFLAYDASRAQEVDFAGRSR